jgi:outer membrane protein OmpA-like peptidoglycan-associated protein
MRLGVRKIELLRVAAMAAIAASTSACSSLPSVPDWVDPTTWFGDDTANPADNAQTPDLASLPDKPATTTPDDQKEVTESLAADRTNAKYSADALRAGTEAAAAPPPNVATTPTADRGADSETTSARSKTAQAAAPAPVRVATVDRSVAREPSGSAMAGTLPATPGGYAEAAPSPEPVQTAALPEPPPAPVQTASMPEAAPAPAEPAPAPRHTRRTVAAVEPSESASPPIGAQPAVPSVVPSPQQMASVSPSDAALGFKPSAAPPLDPSVSQFVAAPIVDHYRQTAANAGLYGSGTPVTHNSQIANRLRRPSRTVAMGGPEHMTGAVVANLEALAPSTSVSRPSVYSSAGGLPATAVVFFPGDGVGLSGDARTQVRAVVEQYNANGAQGFIRVVGHSSSRTANMPVERHMEIIFRKSQERANAVAQEIIREGVPAAKVLVEAVGDTQPVYYESMPKGEDGNRRAEIFLQS